ncbi:MAG: lysylphosphatidylglycerol synthase transmembrane domain-containing protein [Geminicoccaceae bacterium]
MSPERSGTRGWLQRAIRSGERWGLIGVLVSLALFALGAVVFGAGPLIAQAGAVGPAGLAVLLLLSVINYVLRALRWQLFSVRLAIRVALLRNALYYVAGFAFAVTPAKLGEIVRLWFLRRAHGYPYEKTVGLLVVDRLSDALALVLLMVIGLVAVSGHEIAVFAFAALVLVATFALLHPTWPMALLSWTFARVGRQKRLFARARSALRHLTKLGDPRVFALALVLAAGGWFAEGLALHLLLGLLGAPISLLEACFAFAAAMVFGALALMPGGLGTTEVGLVGLLAALGVAPETAIVATAVIRMTTLWFAVFLGFGALAIALRLIGEQGLGVSALRRSTG